MKVTIVRGRAIDSAQYKLAECLAQNGHDVKVLVWDRQGDLLAREAKGYQLHRFGFRAPYDSALVFLYQPIWYLYELLYLLRDDADVVHATDLDTLWPAVLSKMLRRNRLYYTIYDLYANNFPDAFPRPLMRLVRRVFSFLEKSGIAFTDTLFLTDENRFEEVSGSRISRLVYVYNSPVDVNGGVAVRPSRDYTEIFYAGAIFRERGLESLLTAIEDLDHVKLVLAGKDHIGLLDRMSPRVRDKVEYLGWIPHEEVLRRTMATDLLFRFSDPRFPKSRFESPYKVFEAMMSGKPILVSTNTLASQLVEAEGCGIAVPYGDVAAIRSALVRLKGDEMLRSQLGANGRKGYERKYSWDVMKGRLLEAYGGQRHEQSA